MFVLSSLIVETPNRFLLYRPSQSSPYAETRILLLQLDDTVIEPGKLEWLFHAFRPALIGLIQFEAASGFLTQNFWELIPPE